MAEAGSQVLEGFICPTCKKDLGTAESLLSHFQVEHSEDQALIRTFKDLLDKAKKKILKPTGSTTEYVIVPSTTPGLDYEFYNSDEGIGCTVSHTEYFKQIRRDKIDRLVVPTNQLIIRLDKLLENIPTDHLKKKAHEQNTVVWVDGTNVSRCPDCTGVFHLARRQHHCRTCGGIMCSNCSHFMTIPMARKILDKPSEENESGQNSSDNQLRLCVHCISLLETREKIREFRTCEPSQLYEKFTEYKTEANELYILYKKMCNSLNAGESNYNLQEAQMLRVKLLRLAEGIDVISSKIALMGVKEGEPRSDQAMRLQNAVRQAATNYLRNQLLNLPVLPTESQIEEAQNRRRQETTNRIQEEKRKARLQNNSVRSYETHQRTPSSSESITSVSLGQGWIPEKKKVNQSDDPLIEQMNIIRSYIHEAKAANKMDEVASLEANLKELTKAFWNKQATYNEIYKSGDSSEGGSLGSFEEGRSQLENNQSNDRPISTK